MRRLKILGIIMAGGKGERLYPLTVERCKPAVPFGGKYRIIDFVLSNFMHSGIYSIYVLVQYKAQSLIEHLRTTWHLGGRASDAFITVVPPQMRWGEAWYKGTADAVYQNLNLIRDSQPDIVAVFGADHIYRMDISQMVKFHLEKEAQATVAALPVPIENAHAFGVIEADENDRINGFQEKPKIPKPMPTDPSMVYSSMGNYIFNSDLLVETLLEDSRRCTEHDFGKTIIPELYSHRRVFAYNFLNNEVPGIKQYEEKGYWRDVGDIETYWSAHMELLGATPPFDLDNADWPILGNPYDGPATRLIGGEIKKSLIGDGCLIVDAKIKKSILGRGVQVHEGATIEDSIVMDRTIVKKGAKIKRAIVDRFNVIEAGADLTKQEAREDSRYHLDDSGILVIPRGGNRFF